MLAQAAGDGFIRCADFGADAGGGALAADVLLAQPVPVNLGSVGSLAEADPGLAGIAGENGAVVAGLGFKLPESLAAVDVFAFEEVPGEELCRRIRASGL
jgi:hypothetical protein